MESKKVIKAVKKGAPQSLKAPVVQTVGPKDIPKDPNRKSVAVRKAEALSGQPGHSMAIKLGGPVYQLANSAQVATSKGPHFYKKREVDDLRRARSLLRRAPKTRAKKAME